MAFQGGRIGPILSNRTLEAIRYIQMDCALPVGIAFL